jgi:hypothetical protein
MISSTPCQTMRRDLRLRDSMRWSSQEKRQGSGKGAVGKEGLAAVLGSVPVEIRQCFSACSPGIFHCFVPHFAPTLTVGSSPGLICFGISGNSSKVEVD